MVIHGECGAEVVDVGGELVERLMRRHPGAGVAGWTTVPHVCRDYVAWHRPADPRHPDELPWPDRRHGESAARPAAFDSLVPEIEQWMCSITEQRSTA